MKKDSKLEKIKKVKKTKTKTERFLTFLLVMTIITFVVNIFFVFSSLGVMFYYLVAAMVLILSLFTVNWLETGNKLAEFSAGLYDISLYTLCVTIFLSLTGLLISIFSKNVKSCTAKIVANSIFLALSILMLILRLTGNFLVSS